MLAHIRAYPNSSGSYPADMANDLPQGVANAGNFFADQRLKFGEYHFNWIKVRVVWLQKSDPNTDGLQHISGAGVCVSGQIVQNDDVSTVEASWISI